MMMNTFSMEQTPTPKRKKQENTESSSQLDVLGVSRSGRIRKKSSKLMDFESPDDIDTKVSRKQTTSVKSYAGYRSDAEQVMDYNDGVAPLDDSKNLDDPESGSDSDFYNASHEHEDRIDEDSSSSDSWEVGSDIEGQQPRSKSDQAVTTPSSSLYMMEKSSRRKMIVKDGRIIGRAKAQRKDKGKSRVTAYMLWAKETREQLLRQCPDMDFSAVSKRLGEMWANVNFQERYVWKRKARRFAMSRDMQEDRGHSKIISNAAPVKPANPVGRPPKNPRPQQQPAAVAATTASVSVAGSNSQNTTTNGCGAVQVAAHLRLLGESLAIIGERLKEHEGQIAVSGSVSVLLDTLLCSLAPLICITHHIPSIAPPQHILNDTLHNIAYIMPGL